MESMDYMDRPSSSVVRRVPMPPHGTLDEKLTSGKSLHGLGTGLRAQDVDLLACDSTLSCEDRRETACPCSVSALPERASESCPTGKYVGGSVCSDPVLDENCDPVL